MAETEETIEEEDTEDKEDNESSGESKSDDEGGAGDASKKETEGEESGDDEEDGKDKDGQPESNGKKTSESDDKEPEIPVRKIIANQQNIIARKNKTIEKLKGDDGEDDESDGEDNAKLNVQEEIAKALKPILETLSGTVDENDIKDLYSANPEAKKFDRSIRAYMKHPSYRGVAPEVIFHHLAFKDAQAIGAKKKVIADKETSKLKGAGNSKKAKGSNGNIPSQDDLENMTDKEFEELQNQVRQGKFNP